MSNSTLMEATMTAAPTGPRAPLPICLRLGCAAWRKAAGCGHLAARTVCQRRKPAQAELPTLAAQVEGGEQLRLAEEL